KECFLWGVVRQQLLVDPAIPYTSHNSSACLVVDCPDPAFAEILLKLAADYIEAEAIPGSDPGLCLVRESDPAMQSLQLFGRQCTLKIVSQADAMRAAGGVHLSGHGGTNGGIIGAAAAVGLTASGWHGRFIEFSSLRDFPDPVLVSRLEEKNIRLAPLDRDGCGPLPDDRVRTKGWLRPRLWGHEAVLPVTPVGPGFWESLGEKRKK
ncbi:MAG: hypothetical protein PHU03_04225, partial [Syntrophales bacterium]|nr:hypothetical protein [Syntrophales bacterium]